MKKKLLICFVSIFSFFSVHANSISINLTAGELSEKITPTEAIAITSLTITGTMDARDFQFIRSNILNLTTIDLRDVNVLAYSGKGGTYVNKDTLYKANHIPYGSFKASKLNTFYSPKLLESIGRESFFLSYSLKNVSLNNLLKHIETNAFSECVSLELITLPASLETIGSGAFSNTNIESLDIPDKIKRIEDNTFTNCSKLQTIIIGNGVESIGESTFANCSKLNNILFGISLKSIKTRAFEGCSALETMNLPDGLIDIESEAFYRSGIKSVEIPGSIKKVNEIFQECRLLSSIVLLDGVEVIGQSAFRSLGELTYVSISNSVNTIENKAFFRCSKLELINLPQSLEYFGDSIFFESGIRTIQLPNKMTRVGVSTFEKCKSLYSVTLGNNIEVIDKLAFLHCENLQGITIPISLKHIGERAFSNCTKLSSIDLSQGLETIGDGAFSYCYKLYL